MKLVNGKYETSVYRNRKKPMHWTSQVPKKIKRNIITNDLHRAKKISTDFNQEKDEVISKYVRAGYPKRFVGSIVEDFIEKQNRSETTRAEAEEKAFVPIKIPYCEKNEKVAKHFIEKLKKFTGDNFRFSIIWQSKKVKTLFRLKDQIKHRANVIYRGTSIKNPEVSYVGETKQVAEARWEQHENPCHDSAPSKYLQNNTDDKLTWEVLSGSSANWLKRRIHEALFIQKLKPILNKKVEHRKLVLFRNGVT